MGTVPHTFAAATGDIVASQLDDNFTACADQVSLDATNAAVAALPSASVPLSPTAGGAAGSSGTLSKADHRHPPQSAAPTTNTGAVSIISSMDGTVQESNDAGGVTYTFANSITVGCSGLVVQINTGQITFAAAGGATLLQASSYTKTRARYSVVSWYCRANAGSAAVIVLSGDMSA